MLLNLFFSALLHLSTCVSGHLKHHDTHWMVERAVSFLTTHNHVGDLHWFPPPTDYLTAGILASIL